MATKIVYTSTRQVPIYASWKCKKCGCINSSDGVFQVQGASSSGSYSKTKQDAAQHDAMQQVQDAFLPNTLAFITDPRTYLPEMRNNLFLKRIKCNKCGKKPKWADKGSRYTTIMLLGFFLAFISGYLAISIKTNLILWLIFATSIGMIAISILSDKVFEKKINNYPEQYMPVFGSTNDDLLAYAIEKNKNIPTLEECIALVTDAAKSDPIPESVDTTNSEKYVSSSSSESLELIKQIAELHEKGILTDEEYAAKKAELLSKV